MEWGTKFVVFVDEVKLIRTEEYITRARKVKYIISLIHWLHLITFVTKMYFYYHKKVFAIQNTTIELYKLRLRLMHRLFFLLICYSLIRAF